MKESKEKQNKEQLKLLKENTNEEVMGMERDLGLIEIAKVQGIRW